MSNLDSLKRAGNKFLFELALEYSHDKIIAGLREYLSGYTLNQLKQMVKSGRFPVLPPEGFQEANGYAEFLKNISAERLMETLLEASPEAANVIMDMGEEGAVYIVKLRAHLLGLVLYPEKAMSQQGAVIKSADLVKATCDNCGKSWPVARTEVAKIALCPFCGKGKDEG